MLSTRTLSKFSGIRKCSAHGHKVKDLFQLILNAPDLWAQAYGNISANKGGLTKGAEGPTLEGYSDERAANTCELLRENRYVPSPARRVYIPKPNGKQRPLGMPNAVDKQVQEVWRMVLESIYEPVFSEHSHGFRPQRSCHTALKFIERTWAGTRWFMEFDIEGYFDNIDHGILMQLLEKKIDDTKFLNVIRKMLKAGYVEDWRFHNSHSGTPQGGIISPILANIYLHELDCHIDTLISDFNQGKKRAVNPEYNRLKLRVGRLNKKIAQETSAERKMVLFDQKADLQRQTLAIPSKDLYDPKYRRLGYCRYADDFLLSVIGPQSDAEDIFRNIENFLTTELKLTTSKAKSGIKHHSEDVRFLGYDIRIINKEKMVKGIMYGQYYKKRSMKGVVSLRVPAEKQKLFADRKGYGNFVTMIPTHRRLLSHLSDIEITMLYSAEMRGIAQYYALADNYYSLSRLRFLWIQSYLKTMANKYKKSMQKVATMLNHGSYMAVRVKGKNGKMREVKLFKLMDVKRDTTFGEDVDAPPFTYNYANGSELLQRMNANKCEYCEKEGGYFQIHHVKKLADIKDGKQPWQKLMIARARKTLVLCVDCHQQLTHGKLPDRRHLVK
jgi:group II intron reverse transcriptase/maturase